MVGLSVNPFDAENSALVPQRVCRAARVGTGSAGT
jgi:hypothetical protein